LPANQAPRCICHTVSSFFAGKPGSYRAGQSYLGINGRMTTLGCSCGLFVLCLREAQVIHDTV